MPEQPDPRHEARKLAVGAIFCWAFSEENQSECLELTKELLESPGADQDMVMGIVEGTKEYKDKIDEIIEKNAPDWPLDKISKIDLVILRIALFELLFKKDMPQKVAIDEAVELAKEFGNDTSGKFINGVLGAVIETDSGKNQESVTSIQISEE